MGRWLGIILLFASVGGHAATAAVPELLERAILPSTPALPTCACVVAQGGRDQLAVGLADGHVVVFHETAGDVFARIGHVGDACQVDDIESCRLLRPGGSGTEFVLFAVCGRELYGVAFEDMSVRYRLTLPAPKGQYRFAKVWNGSREALNGFDRVVLYDDDTIMRVIAGIGQASTHFLSGPDTRNHQLSVEPLLDGAHDLTVTVLSDRLVACADGRAVEFLPSAEGISRTVVRQEPPSARGSVLRTAAGAISPDGRSVHVLSALSDSVWLDTEVAFPGSCSVVVPVADSLLVAGGKTALTPDYDVGRILLIGGRGRIIARSDHGRRVTSVARLGHYLAVQGDRRNLSLYDMRLRPIWDNDSPVETIELLGGDFAGDASRDLAVVGIREYAVSAEMADSIRMYLDRPDFMAGSAVEDGARTLRRSFMTYYVSNALGLWLMMGDGRRLATEAFAAGDIDVAIEHAMAARGAAAALGRPDDVDDVTGIIAEYVSFPRRRRWLLATSAVLAALGFLVAGEHWRSKGGLGPPLVQVALLLAGAAVTRRILGH
ncbi:MAG: hypothetical protein JXB46_00285, partial [Candidatus Eisenbacteria bacterium]|nr:hypothetical protein [Candidatus Eisenbacteria bacterium]